MYVGEQMIRAEITVRRYDRSSCLICQDEGWHSASFIHCWWKYEGDLRHLAPAQKKEKQSKKKAPNDKWHVILSHFWPCCSLTCSTTATNVFHGEPSAGWLATEGSVTRRKTCADVRKTSSPSSSLLLMFRSSWLSSVSGTDSPKAFFAAVFIGMHAHVHRLSARVDYRSIRN